MSRQTRTLCTGTVLSLLAACGTMEGVDSGVADLGSSSDRLGQPSAKVTGQVAEIAVLNADALAWRTVLSNTIKAPSNRTLFIHGSLECGLYTNTVVRSSNGKRATSTARASVMARVLVNGAVASPGEVVFCSRIQALTAVLQGLLTDADGNTCLYTDLETGTTFIDEECVRPEEVGLLLETMNANAFNFLAPSNGSVNTVEFQAMIDTSVDVQVTDVSRKNVSVGDADEPGGEAEAYAAIGKGAVLVEAVRGIRGEDWTR